MFRLTVDFYHSLIMFNHVLFNIFQVKQSIAAYYHNVRQSQIRNAQEHWDCLYASAYLPNRLVEEFRTIYSTYTPRRQEESFVVGPWNTGHYLFERHIQKSTIFSSQKLPSVSITRSPRPRSSNGFVCSTSSRPKSAFGYSSTCRHTSLITSRYN